MRKLLSFLRVLLFGNKLRVFLIGMILGQCMMYPIIVVYRDTPIITALPFEEKDYNNVMIREYVLNDVRNIENKQTVLVVHIAPISKLQEVYAERNNEEVDLYLMGFYDYKEHDIWTVDSTDILVHELRHIFEGGFHRSADEIKEKGRFKVFYVF